MKKITLREQSKLKIGFDDSHLIKIAFLLPILGCTIDQVSTRIGLTNSNLYELNPQTITFMSAGVWLYVDVAAVLVTISVSYFIYKYWSFKYKQFILLFPLTLGFLRLLVGISNFYLFFTY